MTDAMDDATYEITNKHKMIREIFNLTIAMQSRLLTAIGAYSTIGNRDSTLSVNIIQAANEFRSSMMQAEATLHTLKPILPSRSMMETNSSDTIQSKSDEKSSLLQTPVGTIPSHTIKAGRMKRKADEDETNSDQADQQTQEHRKTKRRLMRERIPQQHQQQANAMETEEPTVSLSAIHPPTVSPIDDDSSPSPELPRLPFDSPVGKDRSIQGQMQIHGKHSRNGSMATNGPMVFNPLASPIYAPSSMFARSISHGMLDSHQHMHLGGQFLPSPESSPRSIMRGVSEGGLNVPAGVGVGHASFLSTPMHSRHTSSALLLGGAMEDLVRARSASPNDPSRIGAGMFLGSPPSQGLHHPHAYSGSGSYNFLMTPLVGSSSGPSGMVGVGSLNSIVPSTLTMSQRHATSSPTHQQQYQQQNQSMVFYDGSSIDDPFSHIPAHRRHSFLLSSPNGMRPMIASSPLQSPSYSLGVGFPYHLPPMPPASLSQSQQPQPSSGQTEWHHHQNLLGVLSRAAGPSVGSTPLIAPFVPQQQHSSTLAAPSGRSMSPPPPPMFSMNVAQLLPPAASFHPHSSPSRDGTRMLRRGSGSGASMTSPISARIVTDESTPSRHQLRPIGTQLDTSDDFQLTLTPFLPIRPLMQHQPTNIQVSTAETGSRSFAERLAEASPMPKRARSRNSASPPPPLPPS